MKIVKLFLLALCLSTFGCSGSLYIERREEIAKDAKTLSVQISSAEAEVQGLTDEISEAKVSRDIIGKIAETATGWAKEPAVSKLEHASKMVEFKVMQLTYAKKWLARLKESKNNLKHSEVFE